MQTSDTQLCSVHCWAAAARLPASTACQDPSGRPSLPTTSANAAPAWLAPAVMHHRPPSQEHLHCCPWVQSSATDPQPDAAQLHPPLTARPAPSGSADAPLQRCVLALPAGMGAWRWTCCPGCGQLSCTTRLTAYQVLQRRASLAALRDQPVCPANCPGSLSPSAAGLEAAVRTCPRGTEAAWATLVMLLLTGQCCSWELLPLCSGASLRPHLGRPVDLPSLSPSSWLCQGHSCSADAAARSRPPRAVGPA